MNITHKWPEPGWYEIKWRYSGHGIREVRANGDVCDIHGAVMGYVQGSYTCCTITPLAPPRTIESLTARVAELEREVERLRKYNADLEKSDCLLSKMLSQLDRMEEHIAEGKLIGDGKWRINEIVACIVAMQSAWEESRIADTNHKSDQ